MPHHTIFPKKLLPFIWHFAKPYRWSFVLFLLAPTALILEATVLPYSLKMIVDTITNHQGGRENIFSSLAPALWLAASAWITMIVIFRVQEWWQCYVFPKFEADIRLSMFAHVHTHSYQYFINHFSGSIANKISDMVNAIRNLSFMTRWLIISTLSVVAATLVMVWMISPIFSVMLLTWISINMIIVYPFACKADQLATQNAEDRSTLSGKIVDAFTNIMNVQLFARSQHESVYLNQYQNKEKRSHKKLLMVISNAKIATEIPALLLFIGLFYVLITKWQQELITSGDFVFVFYASFNTMLHVWRLSMEMPNFFKEVGVAKQALSIIASPNDKKELSSSKPLKVTQGEIVFDNVHFHYVPGKDIFRDKSMSIRGGEKVGLVGFSGSGKSTFVNLILRFYDVESGAIRIDNQNIQTISQDSLRQNIAMIPQDTHLFHRTIMENIRYGRLEASDEEVIEASKKAHCHEFIQEMSEKYQTLVGERGLKLSGGQRQRIAVARAILKNAPILILDEATSSLDSLTEKYIQASLQELMQARTTIVVAHRLSTLSNMDRILVFQDGQIIENGTHENLLSANGHYAELWNMQVGGFLPDAKES